MTRKHVYVEVTDNDKRFIKLNGEIRQPISKKIPEKRVNIKNNMPLVVEEHRNA